MQDFSFESQTYEQMNDEKLLELIQLGDNNALNFIMNKYNNIVNMKASRFFAIGVEKEDIIQEGLIGLYKATQSYNVNKQNSFKSFANMCIERQLITMVKSANRQKNIPLNSAFSLNSPVYDEGDSNVIETLNTNLIEDPLDTIEKKEYFSQIQLKIDENLSDFEREVLSHYKQGKSYATIAKELNIKIKSVDTAIQRIRKKANKIKNQIEE